MPLHDYIIAVYCLIDDLYLKLNQPFKLRKAGYAPQVSDNDRRRIETVISQLIKAVNFNTTKTRSLHGLIGRLNRKILSYTTALFFKYQLVKDQFTQLELLLKE